MVIKHWIVSSDIDLFLVMLKLKSFYLGKVNVDFRFTFHNELIFLKNEA